MHKFWKDNNMRKTIRKIKKKAVPTLGILGIIAIISVSITITIIALNYSTHDIKNAAPSVF